MNPEPELNIEKFSPAVSEIQKAVDESRGITISDFTNKAQLKLVKDTRINLGKIRISITKQGKELRQDAVNFSKKVIDREKELIALVQPEEDRLSALEDRANKEKELAERRELLPKRNERLVSIGDGIIISNDEILEMDGTTFEGYCNKRFADKNEKDRIELEEKSRAIKAEENKLAQEKEMHEREEKARIEERERFERIEKDRKEREEREKREAKDLEIRKKAEAEAAAKADTERKIQEEKEAEEKLKKDKKYQKFLTSHGWTEKKDKEFYIDKDGDTYSLYKKVGEITL